MQNDRSFQWPHRGEAVQVAQTGFLQRVYGWMTFGLLITAAIAWTVASNESLIRMIYGNRILYFGLIIAELLLVISIGGAMARLSASAMAGLFALYSALNGATLAVILWIYTGPSIAGVFLITAGTFGAMSFYGMTTKRDLSGMGALMTMGLFGLILAMIVNIFLRSDAMTFVISLIGVGIFVGLTAYDTQKLKRIHEQGLVDGESGAKLAILGALALYLDFINLFLFLLRLLGRRR